MCGIMGNIVVVLTGCSREEGTRVVGLLFCFNFGNASMLISIYFVLLPRNREARVRVFIPLQDEELVDCWLY